MQLPRGLARKLPGVAVSSPRRCCVPTPPAAAAGAPAARDRARAIAATAN
jgi:hypothetical protein